MFLSLVLPCIGKSKSIPSLLVSVIVLDPVLIVDVTFMDCLLFRLSYCTLAYGLMRNWTSFIAIKWFSFCILNLCTFYWKIGGHLNRIRTTLKYVCPAEHIPSKIEVDLSNLDIGDKVFMQDIKVHSSLKLLSKNESIPVCKVAATNLEKSELPGT